MKVTGDVLDDLTGPSKIAKVAVEGDSEGEGGEEE